jgi:hypothetical protein
MNGPAGRVPCCSPLCLSIRLYYGQAQTTQNFAEYGTPIRNFCVLSCTVLYLVHAVLYSYVVELGKTYQGGNDRRRGERKRRSIRSYYGQARTTQNCAEYQYHDRFKTPFCNFYVMSCTVLYTLYLSSYSRVL